MHNLLNSYIKRAGLGLALVVGLAGNAPAAPTLTAAATTAGFTLSMFADQFPVVSCCGPLGIAFPGGGQVMVTDYPGNIRLFPTDADGQHATSITPVITPASFGSNNTVGLAKLGNFIYLTLQQSGTVERLNLDGTFNSHVVTGIPTATGIAANPFNNKLYVSDCCNGSGIYAVDPVTNTKTQFKTFGSYDGLTVSGDGLTLYAELGGTVRGYTISTGVEVFNSGSINGVDGTELGAGTLNGKIFANTNFGELWEIDLALPNDPVIGKVLLVTGGSRGDFVTADPNGSLLFTQTSDIWRLTAPAGGCIGAACGNAVPEPSSLALTALALLGLSRVTRRRSVGII